MTLNTLDPAVEGARLAVHLNMAAGATGTAWFDDVVLTESEDYREPELVVIPVGAEEHLFSPKLGVRFKVRCRNLPPGENLIACRVTDLKGETKEDQVFNVRADQPGVVEKEFSWSGPSGYFELSMYLINPQGDPLLQEFCYLYRGKEPYGRYETSVAFGIMPPPTRAAGEDPFVPIGFST